MSAFFHLVVYISSNLSNETDSESKLKISMSINITV